MHICKTSESIFFLLCILYGISYAPHDLISSYIFFVLQAFASWTRRGRSSVGSWRVLSLLYLWHGVHCYSGLKHRASLLWVWLGLKCGPGTRGFGWAGLNCRFGVEYL